MLRKTGSFFAAFLITLGVLLPLSFAFVQVSHWQNEAITVTENQTAVPITPGAQAVKSLLIAVAGEEPDFALLRMDCPAGKISAAVVPGKTVVNTPEGTATLAQCYAAAGPARVAQLLAETLDCPAPPYLAATAEGWDAITGNYAVQLDLSAHFTGDERRSLGLFQPRLGMNVRDARKIFTQPGADAALCLTLRTALWQGYLTQAGPQLSALPGRVRNSASALLTNLTAVELSTLEQGFAYLAEREPEVTAQPIPGKFDLSGKRYELGEGSVSLAQKLLK